MSRPDDRSLRRILGYLGVRPRPVLAALLLGIGGALSALGLAALSAWLITRAWQMPPILYLSVAITAVRALGISRGLFRYLERLATHDLALRAMASARSRIFVALAAGNPSYSVLLGRGDLLTRTGADLDDIGNALIRGVIPIGIAAVTNVAAVVIMAFVSVPAAGVLAVALLISSVAAPTLAARGAADVVECSARARADLAESVTLALWHADELAVARRRGTVLAGIDETQRLAVDAADRGQRLQSWGSAATPLALGVSLVAACLIGIGLAGDPGVSPMTLGVLILLPLSAFEATAPLTEAGLQLERSRQAARRILTLIDDAGSAELTAAEIDEFAVADDVTVDDRVTGLDCRGLRWGWPTSESASTLTMTLSPGQRVAVVGASGVGKTALLLTMAGLLEPRSGAVTTSLGTDLGASTCYFADDAHVFTTSVAENLRVARGDATDEEIVDALGAVGLGGWVDGLPDGVGTVLAGGTAALSGGQRRRLLLARALLHRAPVVLLDEPTEHLDPDDADDVLRDIFGRRELFGPQRSVVVVTHRLPPDHGADRVITLAENGAIGDVR
ncbi:thiol reductant ABC exporter subunit CydC [Gordonia sp. TBRC 11910]|uniref:Thiol reductant ABC exporter subunit CydC n=1 Tax=Gordonia asplenii TaxID=2725283 RepID=A0A848L5Y3_9ACTN|nr:thiol reductant ABC exporter subunit CydC [Gordonia asplenii]NMO04425.1 thiol reductant ABC exporter subunit CydC [Gordonia asplenii]